MIKSLEIFSPLRPFSHHPGICMPLPSTQLAVEIFPTCLRLYLIGQERLLVQEMYFDLKGPIHNFTALLDLEEVKIRVFGESKEGYFEYWILPSLEMVLIRGSSLCLHKIKNGLYEEKVILNYRERSSLGLEQFSLPLKHSTERLFLGNLRKQQWEHLKERLDLSALLPLWFRLGSLYPSLNEPLEGGPFLLLEKMLRDPKEQKMETLKNLFLVAFHSLFVPRLKDTDYQGILSEEGATPTLSPWALLSNVSQCIRALFIEEIEKDHLSLLPQLPSLFPMGKMIRLEQEGLGEMSFEWSKGQIRRWLLKSSVERSITLTFPSEMKSCRLRFNLKERGRRIELPASLVIKSHALYVLDQFQK